jgi:type II secretory pathway pseudopilin PulG
MFRNSVRKRPTGFHAASTPAATGIEKARASRRATRRRKDVDMKQYPAKAFTIVELLVVVSIIALLVGILLPAIGRARDGAQLTRSQGNLRQIGTAAATYQAEFRDRQFTLCNDNLQRFAPGSGDPVQAVVNYNAQLGSEHPGVVLGLHTQGGIVGYWCPPFSTGCGQQIVPINWSNKVGAFRMIQARQFSQYLNGRFYDAVYYAPKDTAVLESVQAHMEWPGEYYNVGAPKVGSYVYSPAAMFNPDVLSDTDGDGEYYTDEWDLPAGFRSPTASQATFPDLKTQIIEHHWLQGARRRLCNAAFASGPYDGCQPYFFNASIESQPMCLFFDGHIAGIGVLEATDACWRLHTQATQAGGGGGGGGQWKGTWSCDTPLGGEYTEGSANGYYMGQPTAFDWATTSFHILTRDGIKGRDTIAMSR